MPPLEQVGVPGLVVDVVVLSVVVVVVLDVVAVVVVVSELPRVTDISSNQGVGLAPCPAETSTPVGVPLSSI